MIRSSARSTLIYKPNAYRTSSRRCRNCSNSWLTSRNQDAWRDRHSRDPQAHPDHQVSPEAQVNPELPAPLDLQSPDLLDQLVPQGPRVPLEHQDLLEDPLVQPGLLVLQDPLVMGPQDYLAALEQWEQPDHTVPLVPLVARVAQEQLVSLDLLDLRVDHLEPLGLQVAVDQLVAHLVQLVQLEQQAHPEDLVPLVRRDMDSPERPECLERLAELEPPVLLAL